MEKNDVMEVRLGPVLLVGPKEVVREILEERNLARKAALFEMSASELRDTALGFMLADLHDLAKSKTISEFLLKTLFNGDELLSVLARLTMLALKNPKAKFE